MAKKRIQLDDVNEGVDLIKNETTLEHKIKKRGGQTKKESDKANIVVNVRFTANEKEKLAKNAKKKGLTLTAMIKSSIANNGGFD